MPLNSTALVNVAEATEAPIMMYIYYYYFYCFLGFSYFVFFFGHRGGAAVQPKPAAAPRRNVDYKKKYDELVAAAAGAANVEVINDTEPLPRMIIEYVKDYGNVILQWDTARHGFCYYSDLIVPYHVLYTIATKYVVIFHCVTRLSPNPDESDALRAEQAAAAAAAAKVAAAAAVAAAKRGRVVATGGDSVAATEELPFRVKFIRGGNIRDYVFFPKPKKIGFTEIVAKSQTKILDYKDYKSRGTYGSPTTPSFIISS